MFGKILLASTASVFGTLTVITTAAPPLIVDYIGKGEPKAQRICSDYSEMGACVRDPLCRRHMQADALFTLQLYDACNKKYDLQALEGGRSGTIAARDGSSSVDSSSSSSSSSSGSSSSSSGSEGADTDFEADFSDSGEVWSDDTAFDADAADTNSDGRP
jgi:hypothetical protein